MRKGQIFSLDFLLALVIIIACIGLAIQAFELNAYHEKERYVIDELNLVGAMATEKFVTMESIACSVKDTGETEIPGFELVNCVDPSKVAEFTRDAFGFGVWTAKVSKASLGIPDEYNCRAYIVTPEGIVSLIPLIQGCSIDPGLVIPETVKNVYSIQRKVFFYDEVSKSELYSCIQGGACNLGVTELRFDFWKE